MLSNTTLDNLIKGNESELALLEQAKAGATEIFDGLVAEAFKRKLELDCLKENLETIRQNADRGNNTRHGQSNAKLSGVLKSLIKECKKAQDESDTRFEAAYDDAHEEFRQKVQNWNKEDEHSNKRRAKTEKLKVIRKELSCAELWDLQRKFDELYDEELMSNVDITSRDYSQIRDERDRIVDKAWGVHEKENSKLKKRIESLEQIAKDEGFELNPRAA